MSISLESRFKSFMNSVEFAESIDDLLEGKQYEGMQRADYLLGTSKNCCSTEGRNRPVLTNT